MVVNVTATRQVPHEAREHILAMRKNRRQELADEKRREEEIRIAHKARTGTSTNYLKSILRT